MKDTWNLYRCSPLLWADLPYEEALYFRVNKAMVAKDYYRIEARALSDKDSNKYRLLVKLYNESDNAVKWNRKFIDEIIEARKREKNENYKSSEGGKRSV